MIDKTSITSLNALKYVLNTLRLRQNGHHFPDDIFKCIFLNENVWNSLKTSLKFVPRVPINNIPALDQIMAWRRLGDKPSSEPMMVCLLTQMCVTRPQWVKWLLDEWQKNQHWFQWWFHATRVTNLYDPVLNKIRNTISHLSPPWVNAIETWTEFGIILFHSRKWVWKYRLENGRHFAPALMCW